MNSKYSGFFGLERETLRVDRYGKLADTPHPLQNDENITRDFCENQIELITPVCRSIDEAAEELGKLDRRVNEVIGAQGESLWMYSNPPHFETEDDIPIADFKGGQASKTEYRKALHKRYGKRLMLLSGVHFNFSFSDECLVGMYGEKALGQDFKNEIYLRLYKQLMKHSWLLVLLTAQSGYYDRSFDDDRMCGTVRSRYRSLRNSERGYWNSFVPVLDHSSVESFCKSIKSYVDSGDLFSVSELYLPVRLKPKGLNSLDRLSENGVDHIELRMFDLVPDKPHGIDTDDLRFAHLLMLYLLSLSDSDFTEEEQTAAVLTHKTAALYDTDRDLLLRAGKILSDMAEHFKGDRYAEKIISYERNKLNNDRETTNYYDRGEENVRAAGLFGCEKHRPVRAAETVFCTQR